jgi:hypothetical protein
MWVLLMEAFYEVRVEMKSSGIIYTQNFMVIGTGIQAILRFAPKLERL